MKTQFQVQNINPSKIDSIFTNQMVLERNIPSLQSGEAVCHPRATGGGIQLQPCHTSSMARVFDNDENPTTCQPWDFGPGKVLGVTPPRV